MTSINDLELFNGEIPKRDGEGFSSRDYLVKPNIEPYLIYTVLKNKFGLPNNEDFDEDKSQWSYLFTVKDFYIHIYDWKTYSTSIAVYHKEKPEEEKSKKIAKFVENFLIKQAAKFKNRIQNIHKTSKHKILENPFYTYFSTAESLFSIGKKLEETHQEEFNIQFDKIFNKDSPLINEISFENDSPDLYRSAFLMYLSSFEGFLNLTYELYLKSELKNERIAEKIAREQIDIKLSLLPIYCSGFREKTISRDDERFKNYFKLVNLRNDFVHANIVRTQEKYIIQEDDYIFIIQNEESSILPTNINNLSRKHIDITRDTILEIVNLVLDSMTIKQNKMFRNVLFDDIIEIQNNENKISIR